MTWPQATDYNEAMQNLAVSFRDPKICAGQLVTNAIGLPLIYTGNFAAVFKVQGQTDRDNWAVKCFTRHVSGLQERYREIGEHLDRQRLPFMVEFRYLADEVTVGQEKYPVLKMDWVEGLPLDEFLADCLTKPNYKSTLRMLCDMWLRLARRLREADVGHGDLQHGNVMLVPDRAKEGAYNLRLIDYDGMYVPALADTPSSEAGHAAYQHPRRLAHGDYGPEVDRFAHLVIYTTLRGLIADGHELWDRHYDGDRLLLGPEDIQSPEDSAVFRELWHSSEPAVRSLAGHLLLACKGPLDDVPLLDELVTDSKIVQPLSEDQQRQVAAWIPDGRGAQALPEPARTLAMPRATDYVEAIQDFAANFRNPDIRGGRLAGNSLGLPLIYTGDSGAVFRVHGNGGQPKWAVKCFTRHVPDLQMRYREIGVHLRPQRLPFMVDFQYLPNELTVGPEKHSVLQMDWVEGPRLDEFLEDCLTKPNYESTLRMLCGMWLRLARRLREAEVGHGDIEHGNVLLVQVPNKEAYNLRLIDYDGMYVPALADTPSGEAGHPAYQHPGRLAQGGYGPEIDRFSHILVYTTLRCLIAGGRELWERHYDGDRLLLGPQDIIAPEESPVFRELWQLPEPAIQDLVGHLILAARGTLDDVPLLDELVTESETVKPLSKEDREQVAGWMSDSDAWPELDAEQAVTLPMGTGYTETDLRAVWGASNGQYEAAKMSRPVPRILPSLFDLTATGAHRVAGILRKRWRAVSAVLAVSVLVMLVPLFRSPPYEGPGIRSFMGHEGQVLSVAYRPNGLQLLTGSADHTAIMWDAVTGRQVEVLAKHSEAVNCVAFSPEGRQMLTGSNDDTAILWYTDTGERLRSLKEHSNDITSAAFDPSGKRVVTASGDNTAILWESTFGQKQRIFQGHKGPVLSVAFSPDGQQLLTGSEDDAAILWDVWTGGQLRVYQGHTGDVNSVAFHPEGRQVLTGSADGTAIVWNAATGAVRHVFEDCGPSVNSVAFSPDGTRVLIGSGDGSVILFDVESGQRIKVFQGHKDAVTSVAYRADGRQAVSGSADGTAILWDIGGALDGWDPAEGEPPPELAISPFDRSQAVAHQEAWSDHLSVPIEVQNSIGMKFVLIPPGEFLMGAPDSDEEAPDDQRPQHKVRITHPFYLGSSEVTQGQWESVMETRPWEGEKNDQAGAQLAVNYISWEDAQEFCRRLTESQGVVYRLPTEAEWECACRAGTTTLYHFGDDASVLGDYAWFIENAYDVKEKYPHPVGRKLANAWGLFDMHGNVWEWCQDGWADGYDANAPATDAPGASIGPDRVVRGGSWYKDAQVARATWRFHFGSAYRVGDIGFRVAIDSSDVSAFRVDTPDVAESEPPPEPEEDPTQQPALAKAPFDATRAQQYQQQWADFLGSPVEVTNSINMKLVLIPPGEFMMGSPESDPDADDDEKPQHTVRITQPYYLGASEVTQAEYQQVMGQNPSRFHGDFQRPVEQVSWDDAVEFCRKLAVKDGRTYRLPTEAEWEYACRAGTTSKWFCGDDESVFAKHGWYRGNADRTTHPVSLKEKNAWGLFDMHGNVWEWSADWYADYGAGVLTDPTGPDTGRNRVSRGGSWSIIARNCRSAYRYWYEPEFRSGGLGFRVAAVRDIEAQAGRGR